MSVVRKVIKGEGQAIPSAASGPAFSDRKVIDREIYRAQQQAEKIRQAAEVKAEQRRTRGRSEAQGAYEAAYRQGAIEGMVIAASRAVEGYYHRGEALRQAIDDCVVIGRHICQKVVGRPLKLGEIEARNIAEEILRRAIERRQLQVVFSTDDWAALERERPLLLGAFERSSEFALSADPGADPGLAVLRLPDGEFNAPIDGVLRALGELFGVPEGPPLSTAPDAAGQDAAHASAAAPDDDPFAQPDEEGLDIYGEGPAEPPAVLPEPQLGEEPSFVEEPATYHDIADLVAEIDAEEEER